VRWLAALMVSAALAGCGGSSSSTTTSTSTSASSTEASVTSTTTPMPTGTTSTSSTSSASKTTTHSTVTTSTTTAAVSTAPPPTPAGTPAAPAGLAQTTGYGTYENCTANCTGSVPSSLRRPLTLPAMDGHTCPTGTAPGPITPNVSIHVRVSGFLGSKWDGVPVTWAPAAGFTGPILIRGRELNGPNAVGFGEGHQPYDELQIYAAAGHAQTWPTFVRVRGPGCYGINIDTAHTTEAFIFEATK
jgi:hypothetical protein